MTESSEGATTETTEYGALHKALSTETETVPTTGENDNNEISYWGLLKKNREFRFYISSYLITHIGEWLTYIASIDFIESQQELQGTTSRTAISVLVIVRLMPNVLLSSVGGTLADAIDRRELMILLDVSGALCALCFVFAYEVQSVFLIYVATFLQQCIAGLYQPSSSSIIPLMVNNDNELKKATTLQGLAWSGMGAFGAAASGFIVNAVGSRSCFYIDGATYLASAFLLWMVRGSYNVSDEKEEKESPLQQFKSMTVDGARYLVSSYFGALVFLKATGALAYGACDILNVSFSEQGDPTDSNMKLGVLFSLAGIGCVLGPLIAEPFIDVERPRSVQLSCVIAFGVSALGYVGWTFPSPFLSICVFALIRAAGSSTIWINSTLLLQKFSAPKMLGRVLAADYALALLTEAISAYLCGVLMDQAELSVYQVSSVLALLTAVSTVAWICYHAAGLGAAKYRSSESGSLTANGRASDSEASSLLAKGQNVD